MFFINDATVIQSWQNIGNKTYNRFWGWLSKIGQAKRHTAKIVEAVAANQSVEFIFQNDGQNSAIILPEVKDFVDNCSTLFDLSHGAGILPEKWPAPIEGLKCGYAGGLSPENLRDQIVNIEIASGGNDYWIDMETHVRSNDDKLFDLAKCEICLEIASEFVDK